LRIVLAIAMLSLDWVELVARLPLLFTDTANALGITGFFCGLGT